MRYLALACDFDGTLATDGLVDDATIAALERLLASGRRLLLVTGRELDDLLEVFPHVGLFDRIVAENGGLLYRPATRETRVLGEAPPAAFVKALQDQGVEPLSVGHTIVATWHPHETVVLETIRALGLELQVIFNKGAVMVLPPGVNKGSGLQAALAELGLSAHNVVGIGDAENDHAFLSVCECAVAVANALPMLKERADIVTTGARGQGVQEIIDQLIADDLRSAEPFLTRHHILLGVDTEGHEVKLPPHGTTVLVAGPSGSGKSTAAIGLLERLGERGYQFCLVDPEGDYEAFDHAVGLGDAQRPPTIDAVLDLLKTSEQNAIVRLVGLPLGDRPAFLAGLLPRLQEQRALTGRPHWIAMDEAHHMLPASWEGAALALPQDLGGLLLVTVHPDHLAPAVLAGVDVMLAVGGGPEETIRTFCAALGLEAPPIEAQTLEPGEVLAWRRRIDVRAQRVRVEPGKEEHRRHRRKYAEGELAPDRSFYFRGPEDKLNLRAQNLSLFTQIAEGVDDETWLHHLRLGDYSRWFREAIKDDGLAEDAARVERQTDISAQDSRDQIGRAIADRYSSPA